MAANKICILHFGHDERAPYLCAKSDGKQRSARGGGEGDDDVTMWFSFDVQYPLSQPYAVCRAVRACDERTHDGIATSRGVSRENKPLPRNTLERKTRFPCIYPLERYVTIVRLLRMKLTLLKL